MENSLFFNKHKKYAKQLAQSIVKMYKLCLLEAHELSLHDEIKFPVDFWKDSYVIGHLYSSIVNTLTIDQAKLKLSSMESAKIILKVSQIIHSEDSQYIMEKIWANTTGEEKSEEFARGKHDALLSFMVSMGKIPSEEDEPILKEAVKVAQNINGMASSSEDYHFTHEELAHAILTLTFCAHIKSKFC